MTTPEQHQAPRTLLICTVGGSPEPVAAAIHEWKPLTVRFVVTPQSKGDIESKILPMAQEKGTALDAGRYELLELTDGEDLPGCLDQLRELAPEVRDWKGRGEGFRVVVDFTGGFKTMSAALALHASRWPCHFSYVGGKERTKDGLGVVVPGAETIIFQVNPWDALGHQAVDDFIVLFDQRAFVAAAAVAEKVKRRIDRLDRKGELSALEQLACGFEAWDRFDHAGALRALGNVEKRFNDLRAVLGADRAKRVLGELKRCQKHLVTLDKAIPPSRLHVLDLLANARRCREEGRVDDAVARLYRAIEATAQVALREGHEIESTEKVPLAHVPAELRSEWASREKDGVVALGLQDAYKLLAVLDDPVGQRFMENKLDDATSPLTARNRSILAHGFDRVSETIFDKLWASALALADIGGEDLPTFPKLGVRL
jgi:CRISPR-associated protein (TIGR02710 family)